ncbi:DUF4268 domain-containing protein [Paracoccus methylarcula]|uniref:DUF4268 domain-containing protein n=1 Tax=Paracoccus methylarcula TaxID=72022 RepID=A0A422QZK7_9RHOB|nr:DUF4268 domain-containing protein [Paracoccus methylarcula]RNF35333.1 DUF4268 domain-containing protein [Paracoccus methylarcula]
MGRLADFTRDSSELACQSAKGHGKSNNVMFRVDRQKNRMSPLPRARFADLQLRERQHLQEWLVHQPDALGEPLLIITKEFDRFEETSERLDVLALDRHRNLVVIENKLDDSGRDVTWQALKYTAYVSTMSTAELVQVHQDYLTRYCNGGSAADSICAFLGEDSVDDLILNPGNGQRIIFVAANFRPEVTATVLWLINRGIAVQCFTVSPYLFGEELFVDVQQVLPPPNAESYMVKVASKEVEESASNDAGQRRYALRREFWALLLEQLRRDGVSMFDGVNPSKENWITAGSGVGSAPFGIAFTQREARVELVLWKADKAENVRIFDGLAARKEEIEREFGGQMEWLNDPQLLQCKILVRHPFEGFDRESWPRMAEWMSSTFEQFARTLKGPLNEIGNRY